jgi:hypothetical protein
MSGFAPAWREDHTLNKKLPTHVIQLALPEADVVLRANAETDPICFERRRLAIAQKRYCMARRETHTESLFLNEKVVGVPAGTMVPEKVFS